MLVISRNKGEALIIGGATVTIVEVIGSKVRLGIEAAPSIPIQRKELFDSLNEQAAARRETIIRHSMPMGCYDL